MPKRLKFNHEKLNGNAPGIAGTGLIFTPPKYTFNGKNGTVRIVRTKSNE